MPSSPGFPRAREHYHMPNSAREHESFDWYESATLTLAASTVFQEVITFSGSPESIMLQTGTAGVDFRLRHRGEAAGSAIRLAVTGMQSLNVTAQIVEARDPTGAGGQVVVAIGRFANRAIERRQHRMGPAFSPTHLHEAAEAYQVAHTQH